MPAASSLTTLVVDDQLTMLALIRESLKTLGFGEILEAHDGEEGLRTMLTFGPKVKLIISDYNMPNLSGLSFLRAVRMHEPIQKTAFIMLTGRADADLVIKAKENGVNNYIVKPFTTDVLKSKIEAVVGRLT